MLTNKKTGASLVMGVIGSDSHAIGNRILAFALKEAGLNVINLGSFVSQEDFINAAIESNAEAILVSSLYGHAEIDCQGFKNKLIEAGLQDVILYIGGTLAVGECKWEDIEQRFTELGFTRIAQPYTRPCEVIKWLEEDLTKNSNEEVI